MRVVEETQQDVACELQMKRPAVAKPEQCAEICVSNLRRDIKALGGHGSVPDASVML